MANLSDKMLMKKYAQYRAIIRKDTEYKYNWNGKEITGKISEHLAKRVKNYNINFNSPMDYKQFRNEYLAIAAKPSTSKNTLRDLLQDQQVATATEATKILAELKNANPGKKLEYTDDNGNVIQIDAKWIRNYNSDAEISDETASKSKRQQMFSFLRKEGFEVDSAWDILYPKSHPISRLDVAKDEGVQKALAGGQARKAAKKKLFQA